MDPALADKTYVRLSTNACDEAVAEARRKFNRVLASWAVDLLALRREGGSTPRWRSADEGDGPLRHAA